ncbi:MAG: DNA methyltransferase [Rhodothalassiaceae bacterium]|nr:MAG: DNA methyltransferase [Rhodothalassiaceae bacterium]
MRVIAGRWRGLKLKAPPGDGLRPSSDRLRETLFNILAHNPAFPPLAGGRVADIFAGTGAVGIEALSRGAAHVAFLERDPRHLAVLRENLARLRLPDPTRMARVLKADARHPPPADRPFTIVYLDPPYGEGLIRPALEGLGRAGWIAADSLVIAETDAREEIALPAAWSVMDRRVTGRAALHFLRPPAGG